MPQPTVPLNGPFHHEEIPRRDIASVKVKLAKAKYLVTELKQNASAGSDDAAESGYNSENRGEAKMLAKELQAVVDVSRAVQAETNENIAAIRELQRVGTARPPSEDSPDLRREASAQVLKLLTGSRDGLRSLIRQLASDVSPEVRGALTEALARATDSQAERWITGAQQAPEVAALQQTIQEKDNELSALKEEIERKKRVAFEFQRDRHQAETNLLAERTKVATSEKQVSRAKAELNRAREKIGTLEEDLRITALSRDGYQDEVAWYKKDAEQQISEKDEEIEGLIQQIQDLDEANMDLEDEKETLASHLLERDQALETLKEQIIVLERCLASNTDHAHAEQVVMENRLEDSNSKLKAAQKEAKGVTQRLEQAERRLVDLEANLVTAQEDLASSRQDIDRATGARIELENTILNQRASLVKRAGEIGRLDGLIIDRDEQVESQIEQASLFLRRLSLDVESDIWRRVAEGVLTDSTVTQAAQIPWQPWRVLPSWSHDEALDVQRGDRSIHAVAVDIVVTLKVPSAPVELLLSHLQSIQDLLVDQSPLVPIVSQILLESFAGVVGDQRLHLMHHVLICQIVGLLNTDEIQPPEVNLDPRASSLVSALRVWDPESAAGFHMYGSLCYSDFVVVGFNRSPPGIISVNPLRRELRWIDKAQIKNGFAQIELLSEEGGPATITLPLDTKERQSWSVAHL